MGLLVSVPFRLCKRCHLDQVVCGVQVDFDGLGEAVVHIGSRVAHEPVKQGNLVEPLGFHQEFQGDWLVVVLRAPDLVEGVHIVLHDHVFWTEVVLAYIRQGRRRFDAADRDGGNCMRKRDRNKDGCTNQFHRKLFHSTQYMFFWGYVMGYSVNF